MRDPFRTAVAGVAEFEGTRLPVSCQATAPVIAPHTDSEVQPRPARMASMATW